MKKYSWLNIGFIFCLLVFGFVSINAQSTNIEYPTPISANEIRGKIKARDIGDSRLTSHYYVFDGNQGDIFITIEANNLEGDIDIFLVNSLKPLTKISLFAESAPTQTGRELYLRKSERMILRVEGRTPNDDQATYWIKFGGSFQSIAKGAVKEEPELPEIKTETEGEVKVNSVGTIIETKAEIEPKETKEEEESKPKTTVAKNTKTKRNTKSATNTTPQPVSTVKSKTAKKETKTKPKEEPKVEETEAKNTKPEVVVTEESPKAEETPEAPKTETPKTKASTKPKTTTKKASSSKKTTTPKVEKTETVKTENVTAENTESTTAPKKEKAPAKKSAKSKAAEKNEELIKALENVKLVVLFKDGATIERPMNEVLRFGVDKGMLTIVSKDGSIGRYSILEITKISVE